MSEPQLRAQSSKDLYRRLLGFAGKYSPYFILSLIGFIVFAAMEATMAHLMKYFIEGLESRDKSLILFVPIAIVLARGLHGIGAFMGNFFIARVGLGVVNDLRKQLFNHMLFLPVKFYDQNNSGELVSLILYNIQQVTGSVTQAVKIILRDGFTVIGLLGYLFFVNWQLTLVFLVMAPLLAGIASVASKYFRRVSRRMQVTMGGVSHITNEAIQGFRLVKSFGGQQNEIDRFAETSDSNTHLSTKYERVKSLQAPVYHLIIAVNISVILFLILTFWEHDTGSAVAYLTAATLIAKPIRQLSSVNEIIQRGLAAAESIFDVIDSPAEDSQEKPSLQVIKGQIQFRQLSFGYDTDKLAVKDFDLTIEPGQTVALVGHSGSGKSTLVNLLLRFYDCQDGDISIDGQNIKNVSLNSLRENIGFVNQQTILFNDTISNNIAYGNAHDKIDESRVKEAASQANAAEFIEAMPEKYAAVVGEDGSRLSGGQKQRLAIARALYKDAPILILDEATSALDTESEKAIQQALDGLQKNRTTLVIAHRLSTIENADKIIVMHNGAIVEAGTHQELLTQNGHYASLHTVSAAS